MEAAQVIQVAKETNKIMVVGMNRQFTPEAQAIRGCVERGDLGEIYFAKAYRTRRSGIPSLGTWFGDKSRSGGGALLDIGVQKLDLCLSLIGNFRPQSVSGFSYTKFGNRNLGEGGWGNSETGERVFDVDDLATTEPGMGRPRYPHYNRFHNWIDAILGEAKVECTLEQAFAVQRIIDAIYESASEECDVRLN